MKDMFLKKESIMVSLQKHNESKLIIIRNCVIVMLMFRALLYIQYYKLIGNYVGVTWFTVLSLLNMALVVMLTFRSYKYIPSLMEGNTDWFKFSLKRNLCTLALNYFYYFMAIYYLLTTKK